VRELSELGAVQRVRPDYPVMSRKRREEGTVTLLIALRDGSVSDVKIERSSGHAALDEAAVSAVRKWRFTAVGSLYARVPITFRLNGRGGI
jgi:protein TonB